RYSLSCAASLTHANVSVLSAQGSFRTERASRWLEAGTCCVRTSASASAAPTATIRFVISIPPGIDTALRTGLAKPGCELFKIDYAANCKTDGGKLAGVAARVALYLSVRHLQPWMLRPCVGVEHDSGGHVFFCLRPLKL